MTLYPPPSPRYIGPPAHHSGDGNKPINRVVIHSTVSPCVPGGAEQIARYFTTEEAGGSAHYVIDPETVIQAAWDSVDCWHAPPDKGTLGLEMCDIPGPVPGERRGTARWKALRRSWRWVRPAQRQMLNRTARLTAQLCLAYDVPVVFLTARQLKRQGTLARGITTHANTSAAFRQSTHWDPGWWPRFRFMRLVRKHVRQIKENHR